MKLARFMVREKVYHGELKENKLLVLENGFFNSFKKTGEQFDLDEVQLLAPVLPGKVIAIGLNYSSHVGEVKGIQVSDEPVMFLVSPTAVIGPDKPIKIPFTNHETHHEAELVVIIGKECTNVSTEEAEKYILGYTCGNDVSDRDIQKKDGQWARAKSYPGFKPLGPWIVTDLNPNDLKIQCRINGDVKQSSNTLNLIKNPAQLVSYISQVMTLYPGDAIYTGTPEKVGPLVPGDICEIVIEKIGILRNSVI